MNSPFELVFVNKKDIPSSFSNQFLVSIKSDTFTVLDGHLNVWFKPKWLKPLFFILEKFNILISEQGNNIPTRLKVTAKYGKKKEVLHYWDRTLFYKDKIRTFNTILAYNNEINEIVDYVGFRGFVYLVWISEYHPPNKFILKTKNCALNLFGRLYWLPKWLWEILFGIVDFKQVVDKDNPELVNINLEIWHPWFGNCFGYQGTFKVIPNSK